MPIIRILAAILLPPLGVFLTRGPGQDFWIAVLLTLLAFCRACCSRCISYWPITAGRRCPPDGTDIADRAMAGGHGIPAPIPDASRARPAAACAAAGEVPVGAVVTRTGTTDIVATSANAMRTLHDPTAHAEILAIRAAAARLGTSRLDDCDLWVTLEPCTMCAGAIAVARIARLYFAAPDPKGGAILHGPRVFAQPTCHHRPIVHDGIGEAAAAAQLRAFFAKRR